MNYWQFKIQNKAWEDNDYEEYSNLKDSGFIYEQEKIFKNKMNNCIGDIVFHYNSKGTKEFPQGIYLISKIVSNVYYKEEIACVRLEVLKDLRAYPFNYEVDFLDTHKYYNTLELRKRAQTFEIIDSQYNPEKIYQKISNNNFIKQDSEFVNKLNIPITEVETIISIRKGQNEFRKKLISYWNGCSITKYQFMEVLVASHIKPWSESDNIERLDVYNGLLLLPNLDKLFDKGYISFNDNGEILISSQIRDYEILGINKKMKIEYENKHLTYLKYHRDNIFIS